MPPNISRTSMPVRGDVDNGEIGIDARDAAHGGQAAACSAPSRRGRALACDVLHDNPHLRARTPPGPWRRRPAGPCSATACPSWRGRRWPPPRRHRGWSTSIWPPRIMANDQDRIDDRGARPQRDAAAAGVDKIACRHAPAAASGPTPITPFSDWMNDVDRPGPQVVGNRAPACRCPD